MNVVWTPKAREDLRSIATSRERLVSRRSARELLGQIRARARQLEAFPDSGRVVPEFENAYVRELIESDHRIIYERFPDRIEVISVIHGRQSLLD